MDVIKLALFLVTLFIGVVLGDELCYDYYDGYFYCEYGCCGTYTDEYCCGVYSWVIAVAVVGTIIIVSVIVVIVCVVYKKKARTGRVINPSGGQTQQVSTINTFQQPGYQTGYQTQYQTHPPPPPMGFQNQAPPPQYPPPPAVYPPMQNPAYPPQ